MQQTRKRLIDTILFFVLIALEAVFIILFVSVQQSDSPPLMADIYVAGIAICAILIVFLGLTRVWPRSSAKEIGASAENARFIKL